MGLCPDDWDDDSDESIDDAVLALLTWLGNQPTLLMVIHAVNGALNMGVGANTAAAGAEVAEAEAANTVAVGRTMSQNELDAMAATGEVQESYNNGVTSVTLPPDPNLYRAGPNGDVFVVFDVPESAIMASGGGTAKIYGPNSIFGPPLGITKMPPATNIQVP